MANPAEHRDLSLPDRIERLEKLIEFDSLPLRKLKDWLEDDLVLDPNTNLVPGVADPEVLFPEDDWPPEGGATDAEGGGTHLRPIPNIATNDFLVPTYPGWGTPTGSFDFNTGGDATVSRMLAVRCVAARTLTVSKIRYLMVRTAAEGANDKFDAGVYNNAGTSLLGSSGGKLINTDLGVGTAPSYYVATFTMQTPFVIEAGLVYVFALQGWKGTSASISVLAASGHLSNFSNALVRFNGGTVGVFADEAKYWTSLRLVQNTASGGTPQTVLPATLTTGCNSFYSIQEPPLSIVAEA